MKTAKYGMGFWFGDKAVIPIAGVMVGAVGLVLGFGGRKMFYHPDIYMTPSGREALFKDKMQYQSETYFDRSEGIKGIVNAITAAHPTLTADVPRQRPAGF